VIIGAGGAGLAAAVAASEKGVSVIVLEKRRGPGGNSAMAIGFFAAESSAQRWAGIDTTREQCFKMSMNGAHWKTNPRIVRAFIDKSGDTVQWLKEKGLDIDLVSPLWHGQLPLTYHLPRGRGTGLTKTLAKCCQDMGTRLLCNTKGRKILTDAEGKIIGVLAETKDNELIIKAKSVIIASGGYGGNKELLRRHCPFFQENMTCKGLPHTGDGLLIAVEIGANTEGLGILQLFGPTYPLTEYFTIYDPETGIGIATILFMFVLWEPRTMCLNKKGKRFIDESIIPNHFVAGNALLQQPDNVSYTIFDAKIRQMIIEEGHFKHVAKWEQRGNFPSLEKTLEKQANKGRAKISDSWDEIADWIGVSPESLKYTIDEYNAFCDKGFDPIFAKDQRYLIPLHAPPYYAVRGGLGFLNTIGGIKINENMEVIDKKDNPIPGLYAAGVDVGGWQADTYSGILPGTTLGFAINSGRTAGENAAEFVSQIIRQAKKSKI
jgi:fumarate reductase flavoprotein subunit